MEKQRNRAKQIVLEGFQYLFSGPSPVTKNGKTKYRYKLSLLNGEGERMKFNANLNYRTVDLVETTTPDADLCREAKRILRELTDEILNQVRERSWIITIRQYVSLRWTNIQFSRKWGANATKKAETWEQLDKLIGDIPLTDDSADAISDRIDAAYTYKKRHRSPPKEVQDFEMLLDEILEFANKEGIYLSVNPFHEKAEKYRSEEEQKDRNTSARSFTREKTLECLDYCNLHLWDEIASVDLQVAMQLTILSGLMPDTICGLDIDHVRRHIDTEAMWLTICQKYKLNDDNKLELITLLNLNEYRSFPCSRVMTAILSRFLNEKRIKIKEEMEDNEDKEKETKKPLFRDPVSGDRLDPRTLRKALKKMLKSVGVYTGRQQDQQLRVSRSNPFKCNANFWFREICRFNATELAVLEGRDRTTTYGRNYVDWNNPLVLFSMAAKMDRWHDTLISTDQNTPKEYCRRQQNQYIFDVSEKGQEYTLRAQTGIRACLRKMEEESNIQ